MGNYIFNGYELPALPERDKTIYPYATIEISGNYGVYAMLRYTKSKQTYDGQYVVPGENREQIYWYIATDSEGTEWQGGNEGELAEDAYSGFVKWSDYDITTTDGTLYLPATAPIPVSTATTWKYNGVELPALPEVDWGTYRFAAIWYAINGGYYYLDFYSKPFTKAETNHYIDGDVQWCGYTEINGEWGDYWEGIDSGGGFSGDTVARLIWANFNVLYKDDGTTYLSLSSPEPVVPEVPTTPFNFHLKSFLMGVVDELAGRPSIV